MTYIVLQYYEKKSTEIDKTSLFYVFKATGFEFLFLTQRRKDHSLSFFFIGRNGSSLSKGKLLLDNE